MQNIGYKDIDRTQTQHKYLFSDDLSMLHILVSYLNAFDEIQTVSCNVCPTYIQKRCIVPPR